MSRRHFHVDLRAERVEAERQALMALVVVATFGIAAGLFAMTRDGFPAALMANLHDLTMGVL